tara:strand:- start:970 stop:1437 length:468 start_codon:yes stop_codon:yes gene_type:complete
VAVPPLLILDHPRKYKEHYERHYCRGNIVTSDGIRIYFRQQKFGHAFYQNSKGRAGAKDEFSPERAQRMDWIKKTLEHPDAELFIGWNKENKCHEDTRRVSVVYESFVVIIELSLKKTGELKGNFVTCYLADNSIDKIRAAPIWDIDKCLKNLEK